MNSPVLQPVPIQLFAKLTHRKGFREFATTSKGRMMRVNIASIAFGFAVAVAPAVWSDAAFAYPPCNAEFCEKLEGRHTRAEISGACKGAGIEYGQDAQTGSYGCIDRAGSNGWIECDSGGECLAGRVASSNPRDPKSYLGKKAKPPKKSQ